MSKSPQIVLTTLPKHLLILIIDYCDYKSLLALSQCCKYLYQLVKDDYVWFSKSKFVIASNEKSNKFHERCDRLLNCYERCKTAHNWKNGRFKHAYLTYYRNERFIPWIQLESQTLWYSKGDLIFSYERSFGIFKKKRNIIKLPNKEDVSKFMLVDDFVICAGLNGTLSMWNKHSGKQLCLFSSHQSAINSIDSCKNKLIITGSKDKSVKLWNIDFDENQNIKLIKRCKTINIEDRVLCVAVNERQKQFLLGTAGCSSQSPLRLYDIERGKSLCQLGNNFKFGAGILQAIYESPNQIMSCGYDTCIRLWDTRTSKNELVFEDPFDSAVFSIASDFNITILSGTSLHSLTRLWDKRYTKNCVQMYYVCQRNSPVYSLSFDSCFAFVALDNSINMLSFL